MSDRPLTDLSFLEIGEPWPPESQSERLKQYEKNKKLWNNEHERVYGDWWRILREEYSVSHAIVFNFHQRLSTLWADLTFGDVPKFNAGQLDRNREEEADANAPDPTANPAPDQPDPNAPTPSSNGEAPPRERAPFGVGRSATPVGQPQPDPLDPLGVALLDPAMPAPRELPERDPAQDTIDDIIERSGFGSIGYEAVIDRSRFGDALFKIRLKDGESIIQAQAPSTWFPVVSRDDVREVLFHVIAWTFVEGPPEDETTYLRVEVHEKGAIENMLFRLDGDRIAEKLNLIGMFPNRQEREETRLEDFMVQHVPGLRASDEFYGKDDYQTIDALVLERMARFGMISRVQDVHSKPSLYGDEELRVRDKRTGEMVVNPGDFIPIQPGGTVPGYLVWDAGQEQQFKFMEVLKADLYEISETTPSSFGNSETGYAESGTSLRLRMVPPLAKARGISNRFDSVVKKTLILAAELEAAWGVEGAQAPETINVSWSDGLPRDPKEDAEIEQTRRAAGNTSLYSSIRRLDGGTDEEIQEELDRIEEEKASSAATFTGSGLNLFGQGPPVPPGEEEEEEDEEKPPGNPPPAFE